MEPARGERRGPWEYAIATRSGTEGVGEGVTEGGDRRTEIPQVNESVTVGDAEMSVTFTPCDAANPLSN
jgi:hypothetical protein